MTDNNLILMGICVLLVLTNVNSCTAEKERAELLTKIEKLSSDKGLYDDMAQKQ